MADLSFLYEEEPDAIHAIDAWYEAQRKPRDYLGLSQAGHKCKRFLWYVHKGYQGKKLEGRKLRLFHLGDVLEDQVVADLRAVGFLISQSQREVVFTQEGVVLKGHIDGIIEGVLKAPKTPHLFECKSANQKKYDALIALSVKKGGKVSDELLQPGSYRAWNETYYWQVQIYMLGLKLTRAMVYVYCKNDSSMVSERIKLDREVTVNRLRSVFEAITSPIEPARACPRSDYFEAKWCPYYAECFGIGRKPIHKQESKWNS